MNSGQEGVIAIREERAFQGGVEVTSKTLIAATDEGVVAVQINTVETSNQQQVPRVLPVNPPREVPIIVPISPQPGKRKKTWSNCLEDFCCMYDVDSDWYDFHGKGFWCVLLLLVMYLVVGCLLLVGGILYCICKFFCSDKD